MNQKKFKVGVLAQYIRFFHSLDDWKKHRFRTVKDGAKQGVQLLVFPEWGGMEMGSFLCEDARGEVKGLFRDLQDLRDEYLTTYKDAAAKYNVWIVAPSIPWLENNEFKNRAFLIGPDGSIDFQDRMRLTRLERESWDLTPGKDLKVMTTPFGNLAINVGYDCEFPFIARRQAEMGAQFLAVPSCTNSRTAYSRVRIASQARALENQFFVMHSPMVGDVPWAPTVDVNYGTAAIYTPPDQGFPVNGVLVQGAENMKGWIHAELDLGLVERVRKYGDVQVYEDWGDEFSSLKNDN